MAQPIITWRNSIDNSLISSWDFGIIDAGTASKSQTFNIWNNYGGSTDVSDILNLTLGVKDKDGGDTGYHITGKWITAKCLSTAATEYTPLGGSTTIDLATAGQTTNAGGIFVPGVEPHSNADGQVSILGVKNDGDLLKSQGNYVPVSIVIRVPSSANAVEVEAKLRLSFQYI